MAIAVSEVSYNERSRTAAGLGLEPRYSPPEGDVLPLDDPAILDKQLLADSC